MIQLFKLVTGEEVIGEGTFNNNTQKWDIKNVVKVILGQGGLAMIPYTTFLAKGEMSVKGDHVVFHGEVSAEIRNGYNSKFGSGLVVAKSGMKLTD
jgi:hypothetical protein